MSDSASCRDRSRSVHREVQPDRHAHNKQPKPPPIDVFVVSISGERHLLSEADAQDAPSKLYKAVLDRNLVPPGTRISLVLDGSVIPNEQQGASIGSYGVQNGSTLNLIRHLAEFQAGDRVALKGLVRNGNLNGQKGTVLSDEAGTVAVPPGTFKVHLDLGPEAAVKSITLTIL